MATFMRIIDGREADHVASHGMSLSRMGDGRRALYCFPVLRDFAMTHQWSRELRRSGKRHLACVQFRIPDQDAVLIGTYNGEKLTMEAAAAVATVIAHQQPIGLEVLVLASVKPSQIMRVYPAPRLVGWRYHPKAKGTRPCHCSYCNRGEIRAQRLIGAEP